MKKLMKNPFCSQCAFEKPDDRTESFCVPCANQGHWYRLVNNEHDRYDRIRNWLLFYSEHGYTKKEIGSIPMMQNLLNHTFSISVRLPRTVIVELEKHGQRSGEIRHALAMYQALLRFQEEGMSDRSLGVMLKLAGDTVKS